jgi:hypothetical protein
VSWGLSIATGGYSTAKALSIATDGWLYVFQVVTPPVMPPARSDGTGSLAYRRRYDDPRDLKITELREKLLREDEEILLIIKLFLRCQD